jgi:hypothetical protein
MLRDSSNERKQREKSREQLSVNRLSAFNLRKPLSSAFLD